MLRTLNKIVVGLGLALAASMALAQVTANTPQLPVRALVQTACTVTTTAVDFGTYDPQLATPLNAQGSISIACTRGASPIIGLGVGQAPSGGQRGMRNTADTTQRIPYDLFWPSAVGPGGTCPTSGGTAWDNGTSRFPAGAAPTKAARVVNVCGRTTQGQDVTAGSYTDSVDVVVTF